jgi:AcrR family transcriptional regulator
MERRERENAAVREKIMEAARDLFVRHGPEAISMRKIAEAIDYSPTAIYIHFKDKRSLIREMCAADFGALADTFRKLADLEDPLERIGRMATAYVRFALRHPNQYRFMFMTPLPREGGEAGLSEDELQVRGDPDRDGYAFLVAAVGQAIDAGLLREELADPQLVAQTLWAAFHGLVALQIVKAHDPWIDWRGVETRTATMLDALLRGMAAKEKRR